jgi:putative glutamine amidotransferase
MNTFTKTKISAIAAMVLAALSAGMAAAQAPPRYFDTAGAPDGIRRLAICYPSKGTIEDILALKEEGLLPAEKFEIVGVFHAKERTNYREALELVEEQKLDWFHFHEISADLSPADLFRTNPASKEFADIIAKSDGLILFGGPDIPPVTYGSKTSLLTVITDPFRHYMELSLVFHLLGGSQDEAFKGILEGRPDFPILGICLGEQTLNAGTGGTLAQDVQSEIYGRAYVEDVIAAGQTNWHTNPWPKLEPRDKTLLSYMLHPIRMAKESKFVAELGFKPGDRPYIMSAHHQAADKVGRGLVVAATSLDGKVVEALEHSRFANVLGVQFHPEFSILWEKEPKYRFTPADTELFAVRTFLEAHPPSLAFNKKIWSWFFGKLKP